MQPQKRHAFQGGYPGVSPHVWAWNRVRVDLRSILRTLADGSASDSRAISPHSEVEETATRVFIGQTPRSLWGIFKNLGMADQRPGFVRKRHMRLHVGLGEGTLSLSASARGTSAVRILGRDRKQLRRNVRISVARSLPSWGSHCSIPQ